ncbi:hypothetical protein K533_08545 [Salmonella enterica subsp. enterica serovar Cubana str. CVM42234]|jgi:hypothetical protein|uniref:Lipoprotein n=18 Tax=Enterobacterales TaxID=91347 RepID=V7IVT1_SALET|nr:hypothetical protein CFSAN002050_22000 [Salmonella enterica subsp. enterica serovar Cubana str. CFSAN002050]ESV51610.1 hypothetical protein K533_08545 [Salmonella enterica subsp. enterica serovar Cubana str. CVM42234]ETA89439.1 hypothetical protein A628_00578 [Salmonella enterica subsp. enterica serovar Cubana str. 76814]KAF0668405.1 hypothetical protein L247_18725 [Salmonella enterica subsp. enterica serovar Worthington str. BCH-7253]KAF0671478.1 hypothetical protein L245_01355 [Salmonella 
MRMPSGKKTVAQVCQMLCLTASMAVCVSTTCYSLRKGNRQAVKNILGAVATCTNGKKDVNALVFDRSDVRTDGIIARTVDIPAAVAMQINERFQSPDSCVSRLLKLSKEMFRENRKRDDRHGVSP